MKKLGQQPNNKHSLLRLFVALCLGLLISFFIPRNISTLQNNLSHSNTTAANVINLSPINIDDASDYFAAQVVAPGNYYATVDSMLVRYDTQGGFAPPRLILMKNHQVLGNENYEEVLQNQKNDCIAVWTTKGFDSIEAWNESVGFKGELRNKSEIQIEKRKASMYVLSVNNTSRYVAFLPVNTKDGGTSYYFHTCNANNKSDFMSVIQSIKFRGDININPTVTVK